LVVLVDTDAPVVGQLVTDPTLSFDATIDTVRIDVLGSSGTPVEVRDFVVPDLSDWPISFGIVGKEDSSATSIRLRIRAFRGAFAVTGQWEDMTTLEPLPEASIDRLVQLTLPTEEVAYVRVVLTAACMGAPVSFLEPATSCLDADRLFGDPASGLQQLGNQLRALPGSSAGSWAGAREQLCTATSDEHKLCVPGGFTLLGELDFSGVGDFTTLNSVPLRPALLSPFLLDRTEFTVGRLRALVASHGISDLPTSYDPNDPDREFCTWLAADDGTNDDLPLNCVSKEIAAATCELVGGALPSEAQWEHAARGRGQRRLYPWGNQAISCCAASVSRPGPVGIPVECPGSGVEPVGAHTDTEQCDGVVDVSRDGVVDLAGSLRELVQDKFREFSDSCWQYRAVARDPVCIDDTASAQVGRGGYWNAGMSMALAPFRNSYSQHAGSGFRCAYPGVAP